MPKHIFFDLDGTLTQSRSEIAPSYREIFERLCAARDVIIVSGAEANQIRTQLPSGAFYILAQHGNHALDPAGKELWREVLSDKQIQRILAFIEVLKRELALPVHDENDLVENRGAQIGYSLIGHHAPRAEKRIFDPHGKRRIALIRAHAADIAALHTAGVDVEPAGTTTIDYFLAGKHKGFNVARLIMARSWQKEDCVYVGDELAPGRNDETVIGVISTKAVVDPAETFTYIQNELLKS